MTVLGLYGRVGAIDALAKWQRAANRQARRWLDGELRLNLLLDGEQAPELRIAPCTVNGVRHDPDCACLHTPANRCLRSPCNCGAGG